MPFTARDLRYRVEQSYPLLYAYLHRNAQRFLGPLQYDAFEVDTVVGHVVEQLVRLGLLGGDGTTPLTALDHFSDSQFYTFLSRSVKNKAIDRLRKRRLPMNSIAEVETMEVGEGEEDPLARATTSIWDTIPFATPEELALHIASQQHLRALLKHCILALETAPHQLQAVLRELQEAGAQELLGEVLTALDLSAASFEQQQAHMSQHKDHAYKKLRYCLQQQSTNLGVAVAFRLSKYGKRSATAQMYTIEVQALPGDGLSQEDVTTGLQTLVAEGLLDWHGEDALHLSPAQMKQLSRFFRDE